MLSRIDFRRVALNCGLVVVILFMLGVLGSLGRMVIDVNHDRQTDTQREEERRVAERTDLHRLLDAFEKAEPDIMHAIELQREKPAENRQVIIDTHLDGIRAPQLPDDDLGLRDAKLPNSVPSLHVGQNDGRAASPPAHGTRALMWSDKDRGLREVSFPIILPSGEVKMEKITPHALPNPKKP